MASTAAGPGPSTSVRSQHRFGHHQGQPLLEAFFQPAQVPGGGVSVWAQNDDDLAAVDLDTVRPDVVGKGVQGAPRDEVEASVVPVAGEQAIFYRPAMKREPHVGAPVVDGVRLAVAHKDTHRGRADLAGEVTLRLQFIERPDALSWPGGLDVSWPAVWLAPFLPC